MKGAERLEPAAAGLPTSMSPPPADALLPADSSPSHAPPLPVWVKEAGQGGRHTPLTLAPTNRSVLVMQGKGRVQLLGPFAFGREGMTNPPKLGFIVYKLNVN